MLDIDSLYACAVQLDTCASSHWATGGPKREQITKKTCSQLETGTKQELSHNTLLAAVWNSQRDTCVIGHSGQPIRGRIGHWHLCYVQSPCGSGTEHRQLHVFSAFSLKIVIVLSLPHFWGNKNTTQQSWDSCLTSGIYKLEARKQLLPSQLIIPCFGEAEGWWSLVYIVFPALSKSPC